MSRQTAKLMQVVAPGLRARAGAALGLGALWACWLSNPPLAAAQAAAAPAAQTPLSSPRVSLDRIVAVVNGDLILETDVDQERRFEAFQPIRDAIPATRDQLIDRLIDRDLILQQAGLQPGPPISDAEVDAELATLRKTLPACTRFHCETDAGWEAFVAAQGLTLDQLRDHWRQRMEVLRFVEARFRMGMRIEPAEIAQYYQKTLLPAYAKQNARPPPETAIADRIQEILLEQRVTKLLDDWLSTLRAQGSVQMLGATPQAGRPQSGGKTP